MVSVESPAADKLLTARRVYERALLDRSADAAERAITTALGDGAHPLEIYDQVIIPSQIAIGERWHDGEIGISEEHIATQISIEQLNRLRGLIKPRPPLQKRAVVGALSGDSHWLGARIVADHFVHDGWEVDFLGASPPLEDLVEYIKKTTPDLVVLSVTIAAEIEILSRLVKKLSQMSSPPRLIVGGRVLSESKVAQKLPKGIHVTSDPRQAVVLGRKLCGVTAAEGALDQLLLAIGQNVQSRRKAKNLSQKLIADSAGLDRAYLSAIEGGKQNCSVGVLLKIASALEISVDELLRIDRT